MPLTCHSCPPASCCFSKSLLQRLYPKVVMNLFFDVLKVRIFTVEFSSLFEEGAASCRLGVDCSSWSVWDSVYNCIMCTMVHLLSCLSLDLNFILHFWLSCWMPVLCVLCPNMLVRYCSQVTTTISQSQAISKRTSQVIPEGILVILPLCHGM
jgi:hypothetical protein